MRLNRRVPVGTHGGVRGQLSIRESLLLDYRRNHVALFGFFYLMITKGELNSFLNLSRSFLR